MFHAIRLYHFEFEVGENAANVSPRKIHAIRFSDFEFETGENAARGSSKTIAFQILEMDSGTAPETAM